MKFSNKPVEVRVIATLGKAYFGIAVKSRAVRPGVKECSAHFYVGAGLRYWVFPFSFQKWWVEG